MLVKNSGSTARDHLANERTFLAWSKTGLGFLGAGTGIFTAYSFNYSESDVMSVHPMRIVPAVLLLLTNGGALLGYGTYRYLSVKSALCSGNFIINKNGLFCIILTTSFSTLLALTNIGIEEYIAKNKKAVKVQSSK